MPIVVPQAKIIIPDNKPPRLCNNELCPLTLSGRGFDGRKLRKCSRCTHVRYCSAECQRDDWPYHKKTCREPRIIMLDEWTEDYRFLLEWAAYEAFNTPGKNYHPDSHFIVISLVRTETMPDKIYYEQDFIAVQVYVTTHKAIHDTYTKGYDLYEKRDRAESRKIQKKGGLGKANIIFMILPIGIEARDACKSGPMLYVQRHDLTEKRPHGYFPQWRGVVKGIINNKIHPKDLFAPLRKPLQVFSLTEEFLEETWRLDCSEDEDSSGSDWSEDSDEDSYSDYSSDSSGSGFDGSDSRPQTIDDLD